MNTVTKPIVSIARVASTLALFGEATALVKSQAAKLETLAIDLAKQVESIALPISSKVMLLEATYSAEYTTLAADRNAVAQLRALVWTKVAGNTVVEVSPPSKDGKTAAVFSPADKLSPKAAKVHLAQLKQVVREAEETPEQKAERDKTAAKIKLEAQVKANAASTEAARVKSIEAFAYVLSDSQRPHLIAELRKIGLALSKCKAAPTAE